MGNHVVVARAAKTQRGNLAAAKLKVAEVVEVEEENAKARMVSRVVVAKVAKTRKLEKLVEEEPAKARTASLVVDARVVKTPKTRLVGVVTVVVVAVTEEEEGEKKVAKASCNQSC